jgi:ABC-type Fe3+/spermidine/putrescine transport system ATPase subunit
MVSKNTGPAELIVRNLSVKFGEQTVLNDLDLKAEKGQFCCVLGPSGCGKTTLLNVIAGFLEPESGVVTLADTEVTRTPPQQRNIGLVFQNYALFPHMNVFENISFGLLQRKVPSDKIVEAVNIALEQVQLSGYGNRRIHELSGGQQQRIALARAMVTKPCLLLLDEPLSNLDAKLREQMRTEIRALQKDLGLTMVYVTHDQEEAMAISDQVIIMNNGRVEQRGEPEQIYFNPESAFVAGFIGQINQLPQKAASTLLKQDVNGTFFGVRPEHVNIVPAEKSAVKGWIKDRSFLGPTIRLQIRIDGLGPSFLLNALMSNNHEQHISDNQIGIQIDPASLIIF